MEQVKAKICLCGDGGVGKTSLINRFVLDQFGDRYLKTIGTKVTRKDVKVVHPVSGQEIAYVLQIWDIMGQGEYRQYLKDSFFFGCRGVLMVFDVTRSETIDRLENWRSVVEEVSGKVPTIVLGNKIDLNGSAKRSEDDLARFCKMHDYRYHFTSAKTGENVSRVFEELGLEMSRGLAIGWGR